MPKRKKSALDRVVERLIRDEDDVQHTSDQESETNSTAIDIFANSKVVLAEEKLQSDLSNIIETIKIRKSSNKLAYVEPISYEIKQHNKSGGRGKCITIFLCVYKPETDEFHMLLKSLVNRESLANSANSTCCTYCRKNLKDIMDIKSTDKKAYNNNVKYCPVERMFGFKLLCCKCCYQILIKWKIFFERNLLVDKIKQLYPEPDVINDDSTKPPKKRRVGKKKGDEIQKRSPERANGVDDEMQEVIGVTEVNDRNADFAAYVIERTINSGGAITPEKCWEEYINLGVVNVLPGITSLVDY